MKQHQAHRSLLVALLALGSVLLVKPASAQSVFNATNTGALFLSGVGGTGPFFYTFIDSMLRRFSYMVANKDLQGIQTRLIFTGFPTTGGGSAGFTVFPVRDREWDFSFSYQMSGGAGADGLAFVVRPGTSSFIGSAGSGLGYMGASCFAIEFDSYNNPDLANSGWGTLQWMGSSYEMREDGIQAALGDWGGTPVQGARTPFAVRGSHTVRITCRFTTAWGVTNPRRISVHMDGAASPQFSVVIPANYLSDSTGTGTFGITAATGGWTDTMIIFPDWSFRIF